MPPKRSHHRHAHAKTSRGSTPEKKALSTLTAIPKDALVLEEGREHSVELRHPWLFSGAVHALPDVEPGAIVPVLARNGTYLGRAMVNPHSQIVARFLTFDDVIVDEDFVRARLATAAAKRAGSRFASTNAVRVVHAEGDGLPGLIVDKYDDVVVFQALTAGMECMKNVIVDALHDLFTPRAIVERSDDESREKEGLPRVHGVVRGVLDDAVVPFREGDVTLLVDVLQGHKTGFYLDQRDSRARVRDYVSGKRVLNAFSYTGAFGHIAAQAGAAHVTQLDASADALALSSRIAHENGLAAMSHVEGDAFALLRKMRDSRERFDVIVLDPPKFASSKAHVDSAARGYKDINRLALLLLEPGGVLFTFSCSGAIDRAFFQKLAFQASVDARLDVDVIEHTAQAPDHPYRLSFPEGEYLKGLVLRRS
jgi:23S rRNA (cytosine1962-C5)-methyltransferase